jgi:hypothetical protein
VKGGLLLDVVVGQSSSVFELFTGEDQSLLIWRDTFFVLDLGFDILDGIRWFDLEGDGLTGEGLDEDLHSSSESEDEMESGLFLDVVVLESSAILKLLSSEDESLLIWGNAFFILDLSLEGLNGIGLLNLKGDGLSGESLDEDLHSSSKSEDEMESGLLLDVVVLEGSAVFELLTGEDKSLLVWGNSFLILDLGLDSLNGIGLLNLEGDGLSGEGLDEDLHTTSKSEDEMESGLLLDVVVLEGTSVFELLTGEDKSLLIWGNAFLVLNLSLDGLDGVGLLNLKGDGFTC